MLVIAHISSPQHGASVLKRKKGKWVAPPGGNRTKRCSPLRIPKSDNSALIEEKMLTLIGRVTNAQIQRPRALVEYMIQYWNLENRVTGRELGPERFFFRFESEADIQLVLKRAPYHFKKWMFIFQCWKPIVSEFFPAFIPFWVNIHDIPMHHCTDLTLKTIRKDLGPIIDKDLLEGRIRVNINGLEPLEMKIPIRLPTGEVTTVHLEYEKLEKHCFFCFSLSHEEKACPLKTSSGSKEDRPSGVKQDRDSHLIVEDKRRDEEKKTHWPHRREEAPRGVGRDYKRGYGEGGRSETRESNNHLSDYSNRIRDSHRYINTREKSSKDNCRSPPRSTRRDSVRSESDSHFQRSHQPCRTSFNEGNHISSHNAAYVWRSHCLSSTRDMVSELRVEE